MVRASFDEARGCPVVVVERPRVYGKPVSHVLSDTVAVPLANSRDVRQRPGKKTDTNDATWLAELLAHGLIQPSFVPPPTILALRDLTRTQVSLVETRTQAKNRVHKILEDTNIKVATVVSRPLWRACTAHAGCTGGR